MDPNRQTDRQTSKLNIEVTMFRKFIKLKTKKRWVPRLSSIDPECLGLNGIWDSLERIGC